MTARAAFAMHFLLTMCYRLKALTRSLVPDRMVDYTGGAISALHIQGVILMQFLNLKGVILGVTIAVSPTLSSTVPLLAGGSVALPGTTVAVEPYLAGAVVNDNVLTNFIDVAPVSIFAIGTQVQNRVVRSDADGTLIFAPRLMTTFNNTGGNFLVDNMTLFGFGDYAVDVNYRTDGSGDRGPTSANRSADGQDLSFDFGFPLVGANLFANPQEDSFFLSLNTEETAFALTGRISVFARHVNYPGDTFRFDFGGIAVPAPATLSLPSTLSLVLGALGLIGALRRRSVQPQVRPLVGRSAP